MKINPQIELPEFKFTDLMVTNECSMEYITGNFSCAKGYFVLERELGIVLTTVEITLSLGMGNGFRLIFLWKEIIAIFFLILVEFVTEIGNFLFFLYAPK